MLNDKIEKKSILKNKQNKKNNNQKNIDQILQENESEDHEIVKHNQFEKLSQTKQITIKRI